MIHLSQLLQHASGFPADRDGHIPDADDDWRRMNFDHGSHDPEEPGISATERRERIEYLDKVWWPQVVRQVRQEHQRLLEAGCPTPFKQWMDQVKPGQVQAPTVAQVEKLD